MIFFYIFIARNLQLQFKEEAWMSDYVISNNGYMYSVKLDSCPPHE